MVKRSFSAAKAALCDLTFLPDSRVMEFLLMSLRSSLLAASLVAVALAPVPAMARAKTPADAAKVLSDPKMQIAVTAALASMAEAMLDLKVGPFMKAMDTATGKEDSDVPADATLRDIAGPQADDLSENIARKAPQMMGAMAGMAGAMDEMLPQLKEMGKRMKDAMPRH
jgi:hypothetical protein